MEIVGIVLACVAVVFTGCVLAGLIILIKTLSGQLNINLTKHNIHEVTQPPVSERTEKQRDEEEKFAKEQAAFMNDAVSKIQRMFVDSSEDN